MLLVLYSRADSTCQPVTFNSCKAWHSMTIQDNRV